MGLNMDARAVAVAPQPKQWWQQQRPDDTVEGEGCGGLQVKRKIIQGSGWVMGGVEVWELT